MLVSLNELRYKKHAQVVGSVNLSLDNTYIHNNNQKHTLTKKELAKEYRKGLMKMVSAYYESK